MAFELAYTLGNYGWATVRLGNGEESAETQVTYMCNPLRQLARLAAYFFEDTDNRRILYFRHPSFISFEDEPGGLILRFADIDAEGGLTFEVCSCTDQHIGEDHRVLHSQGEKTLFVGTTSREEFATAIHGNLVAILGEFGLAEYRNRWVESEFPLTEYARLAALLGEKKLVVKL
jgi:hypothetical protein